MIPDEKHLGPDESEQYTVHADPATPEPKVPPADAMDGESPPPTAGSGEPPQPSEVEDTPGVCLHRRVDERKHCMDCGLPL